MCETTEELKTIGAQCGNGQECSKNELPSPQTHTAYISNKTFAKDSQFFLKACPSTTHRSKGEALVKVFH